MNLACTSCGSENTRNLPLIYREGMSVIDTRSRTTGVGLGGGGIGVGAARGRTTGTQQSLASVGASPPEQRQFGWLVVGCLVALFIAANGGAAVVAGIFLLIPLGWEIHRRWKWNHDVHPALLARWSNTYRCERCGAVFLPIGAQVPTLPPEVSTRELGF